MTLTKQNSSNIRKAAVVGAGLIGASWAALFAAHGIAVAAWDPSEAARAGFLDRVRQARGQLRRIGIANRGRVRVGASLADTLQGADWVQESAPESVPLKHALYEEIEKIRPTTAIASSTSSFTWSELAPGLRNPSMLLTAHPFNPPHLMPLVELYTPDSLLLDRADAFYRSLGRVTVRLKREAAGHIANRLASALWREAVSMVAEGIAEVEDIDRALVAGPGLRWSIMGAHISYHLGGGPGGIRHYLDHLGPSQERRWTTLGHPSLTNDVRDAIVQGVEAEAAGRSIAELEAERDEQLIEALRRRRRTNGSRRRSA